MSDYEDVRTRVLGMVRESCADVSCCPIEPMLEACVEWAVGRRWPSQVTTFVPLLAWRDVQDCIRLGHCVELGLEAAR